MAKKIVSHYIDPYYKSIWVVAKTNCGLHWENVDEFTSEKQYVTCKKCNKSKTKRNDKIRT